MGFGGSLLTDSYFATQGVGVTALQTAITFCMPTVTFPAAERHCPLAGIKLYCLVTDYGKFVNNSAAQRPGFEAATTTWPPSKMPHLLC